MLVNTYFLARCITKLVYTDILDLLLDSHYKLCPEACNVIQVLNGMPMDCFNKISSKNCGADWHVFHRKS